MFKMQEAQKRRGRKGIALAVSVGVLGIFGAPAAQAAGFGLESDRCTTSGSKVFCVSERSGLNWFEAQQNATTETLNMRGGRLATVSSEAENTAIAELLSSTGTGAAWLGGYTDNRGTLDNPGFTWAPQSAFNLPISQLLDPTSWESLNTPEAMSYSNWDRGIGKLEPNFSENEPNYGIVLGESAAFTEESWHDLPARYNTWEGAPIYSVLEFEQPSFQQEATLGQLYLMAAAATEIATQQTQNSQQPQNLATLGSTWLNSFFGLAQNANFAPTFAALNGLIPTVPQGTVPGGDAGQELLAALASGGQIPGQTAGNGASNAGNSPILVASAPVGGGAGAASQAVPTPALLPGLVGFFWKVKRKKQQAA